MASLGIVIAALAAYWVYNDAKKQGYQSWAATLWGIGTLALLFVFFPLYLFLGRRQQTKPANSSRDANVIDVEATVVEETVPCPMCGGKVKEEFKACPYCGYTLKPQCEHCGKELNREWKMCPYCQHQASEK